MSRIATVKRVTGETQIELTLNLDGTGKCDVDNPIGFFDHMLKSFCKHGLLIYLVQLKAIWKLISITL